MKAEKILEVDWDHSLWRLEDGRLLLKVLSGGVAMYEVAMFLSDEERDNYGQEGASFVEQLALKVMKTPSRFEGRLIPPPV